MVLSRGESKYAEAGSYVQLKSHVIVFIAFSVSLKP